MTIDFKLEAFAIPVSDVDRAKAFYEKLGWRLDADAAAGGDFRVVQFTPPGSACSIHFGTGITSASPGSAQATHLIVSDIDAARADLADRGVEVSEVFHEGGPGARWLATDRRAGGRGDSYGTFVSFSDPDGNTWLLQEVTRRLPGRVEGETTYASTPDLVGALKRAAAAHGEHEKRTGEADENWPEWYADYMVKEQSGEELPT
ncbi:MAG TPA: VOC family protein [Gaiellaceae bacterium]|jgi:catechol 2,3-dioxygenase-like lactoylglutathione lyase family enzyme|nr:VOC family protein [Gaiellaceae bacterium]